MALTAAPPLPRRGGSYEKDHIGNIDRQDEQDKQNEKLLLSLRSPSRSDFSGEAGWRQTILSILPIDVNQENG